MDTPLLTYYSENTGTINSDSMTDGDTPSWLVTDDNTQSAPAVRKTTNEPAGGLQQIGATEDALNAQAAEQAAREQEEEDLPRIILFMRLLNMGAALLLMTESVSSNR